MNLELLDLESNIISSFPTSSIGNLNNLKVLDLYDNNREQLPREIGILVNLGVLNLGSNPISSLPNWNWKTLNDLNLSGNQLEHLPQEIENLVNSISSLPNSIGIFLIEYLGIRAWEIEELPEGFWPFRFARIAP